MSHRGLVNAEHFSMQPRPGVPRSGFFNRFFHKTTMGPGYLMPLYVQEVLPGDHFAVEMQALIRLAPMLVPAMDGIEFFTAFFFVPNRLTWIHWEQFMGASDNPAGTPTQYLVPQVTDANNGTLIPSAPADWFGITNNQSGNPVAFNALPLRAYNCIWDHWFRDTSIQATTGFPTGDGPDGISSYLTLFVAKSKDYFTTARPYPASSPEFAIQPGWVGESGFTQSSLRPGGRMTFGQTSYGVGAPVHGLGNSNGAPTVGPITRNETGGRVVTYDSYYTSLNAMAAPAGNFPDVRVLVNDIRTASMIQRYLENDQRGGTEYAVKNWFHFGVRGADARLQRPEYLGGGRTPVTINPVAQTSASANSAGGNFSASTVQASLAGSAHLSVRNHRFSGSFTEHGYIIGVGWLRGDLTYQQGIERLWLRRTPFDFYTPETAHLGEQAILSKEIYSDGSAGDSDVFGYQERWSEYRTRYSRTSGYMRSTAANTIDMWHWGQKFASRPVLNATFLGENPAVNRSLQASAPYSALFIGDLMFDEKSVRPLPVFSIPGAGGRL